MIRHATVGWAPYRAYLARCGAVRRYNCDVDRSDKREEN